MTSPRPYHPWTPEQLSRLRRMRDAGHGAVAIASAVGHSESSVRHKMWASGIGRGGRKLAEKIMTADGPPIAEPTRWITAVEDGRFAVLMAGRRFEDREFAKAPMGSLQTSVRK